MKDKKIHSLIPYIKRSQTYDQISVLGIPIDWGSDTMGLGKAPIFLRKIGLNKILKNSGFKVTDFGDIKVPRVKEKYSQTRGKIKNLEIVSPMLNDAAQKIKERILAGDKIVALGGDHSISAGTISGASVGLKGELGVIWIDSHADLNTHLNTPTGNIHGMSSAAILGLGHPKLINILKSGGKIKKKNILYLGLKDLDQTEIDTIKKYGLSAITMWSFLNQGMPEVVKEINALQKRVKNIWVSMDMDSIDKEFSPASPMATRGGFTYREIINIAKYIGKTLNVVGLDVMEWAPNKDKHQTTAKLALELILALLGAEYSPYTEYLNTHKLNK